MPGINDKDARKNEPVALNVFAPLKKTIVAGEKLGVNFDFPMTINPDISKLELTLSRDDGKLLQSEVITLKGNKGMFALATGALKGGTYHVAATIENQQFGFDFKIVDEELF